MNTGKVKQQKPESRQDVTDGTNYRVSASLLLFSSQGCPGWRRPWKAAFFFLLVNLLIGWFYACMCAAVRLSVPRLMFNQAKDLIFLAWNAGSCPPNSRHRRGTPVKPWAETLIHVSDSCGPCWPLLSLISLSHTSYSGESMHPDIFMQRWIYLNHSHPSMLKNSILNVSIRWFLRVFWLHSTECVSPLPVGGVGLGSCGCQSFIPHRCPINANKVIKLCIIDSSVNCGPTGAIRLFPGCPQVNKCHTIGDVMSWACVNLNATVLCQVQTSPGSGAGCRITDSVTIHLKKDYSSDIVWTQRII